MPRPLRVEFPGALYLVQAHGNTKEHVFVDDADRGRFLELLEGVAGRYRLICYAYCLMTEDYDLLIETPEANISRAMRQLNGLYGQFFRRRHGRRGHVFAGRFKAWLVEKEAYLLEASRHVVLRPVRAGLVGHPSDWPWSSFQATAGEAPAPRFLACGWFVRDKEGDGVAQARMSYRAYVTSGLAGADPFLPLEKSLILGSAAFAKSLRPWLHDARLAHAEASDFRARSRPPLRELLPESAPRPVRNARIHEAYLRYGYTMKAIGDQLHLHYSTVSRIVAAASFLAGGGNLGFPDF